MTNKKHGYDWGAMEFDPYEYRIDFAFLWDEAPQGGKWWNDNEHTPEGQAEFARMKRLYAEDMDETGPVRTVTRKEIIPGVYGLVTVENRVGGCRLAFPRDNFFCAENADELTEVIETLTQIRDAL